MTAPAFKITARDAAALVAITPDGYVAEVRVAFVPDKTVKEQTQDGLGKDWSVK